MHILLNACCTQYTFCSEGPVRLRMDRLNMPRGSCDTGSHTTCHQGLTDPAAQSTSEIVDASYAFVHS